MIQSELILLAASFGFGAGIILSYGLIELVRLFFSIHKPLRVFSELLYWMAAAVVAFWLQLQLNNGMIRLYAVLGLTAGLLLFRRLTEGMFIYLNRKAKKHAAKRRKIILMLVNRLKKYRKQFRMKLNSFRIPKESEPVQKNEERE